MPCFYFDKKQLKNTPSFNDGVDPDTEAQYRRDGARFIIDAGNQLGLRYDSCATGVVYYHRFYMFHSFKEFNRFLVGSTCLFLAGKVEETPKKCRDIIRVARSKLKETDFATFGSDPKEELMLTERVLLQTIKFDLMVEHPYSYLLRYAKQLKGDKDKKDKMVQMAWTFINDSLCTTLSLQWEPDIIGIATIYLASRLSKFSITDWEDRKSFKGKWFEFFVPDINMELIEDVCHQILDLYSTSQQKQKDLKKPNTAEKKRPAEASSSPVSGACEPVAPKSQRTSSPGRASHAGTNHSSVNHSSTATSALPITVPVSASKTSRAALEYGASFMNREGSENIQSLIAGGRCKGAAHSTAYAPPGNAPTTTHLSSAAPQYSGQYPSGQTSAAATSGYFPAQQQYSAGSFSQQASTDNYSQQVAAGSYSAAASYSQYPPQQPPALVSQPGTQQHYPQQSSFSQQQYSGSNYAASGAQSYQPRFDTPPQSYPGQRHKAHVPGNTGIVRISR